MNAKLKKNLTTLLKMGAAPFHGPFALEQFENVSRTMSPAELIAVTTGTKGFEASIFAGAPDWDGLMQTPAPALSAEEQAFLDDEVEELCTMLDTWKIRDELHDLPPEAWQFIKDKKFLGMIIPKEYGGLGFSAQGHSAVVKKIASRNSTAAVSVMVPNSLGPAELLMRYGQQEERDHYLPRLARGEEIPCFGLTSDQAGSDAGNQKDEGVVFRDEGGDLKIRMNFSKRYITLGPIATLMGIAYQLKDPEGLIAGDGVPKDYGITVSLIKSDTPGVTSGPRHRPMGIPFQNGPLIGKDAVVPVSSIIGGKQNAGKGWGMLMDCLAVGRSISLPALSTGSAQQLARTTGAYAAVRKQFGMPIGRMEGVEEALARIGGLTYMLNAAHSLPLQELDMAHEAGGEAKPVVASAILKYHTTEAARQITNDAMDIHAGKAISDGPNNPVLEAYLSNPIGITVEGANILTRNMIIFGQAAFLAHPYVTDEMKTVKLAKTDPEAAHREAQKLLLKHLFNVAGCAAKSVFFGLTRGYGSPTPASSGPDAFFYRQINRLSAGFGFSGNISMMTLQAALKRHERLSSRLADGLSHLYLASQVLRKWNNDGRRKEDEPLMEWACRHCLSKAEDAMRDAIENHPNPLAKAFMKVVVGLPFLSQVKKPSDRLDSKVAAILTTPGPTRDRLTKDIFIPAGDAEYGARLEKAFVDTHAAYELEKDLLRHAKKGALSQSEDHAAMIEEAHTKQLIDPGQYETLKRSHAGRAAVIGVDVFPQEWKGAPVDIHRPPAP